MAASPEPNTSITLRVKVPPGSLSGNGSAASGADEFLLGAVSVSANVGSIRQRIQQLVPSHPSPEAQRLLYGGRALVDDQQTVADALNTKRDPIQSEYVIHLLVRGEWASTPTSTGGNSVGQTRTAPLPNASMRTPQTGQDAAEQAAAAQQAQHQAQQQAQQIHAHHMHMARMAHAQHHRMVPNLPHAPPYGGMQLPFGVPPFQYGPVYDPGMNQPWNRMAQQQHPAALATQHQGQHQQQFQQAATPSREGSDVQGQSQAQDTQVPLPTPTNADTNPSQLQQAGLPSSQAVPSPYLSHEAYGPGSNQQHGVRGQEFRFDGVRPDGQRIQIHQRTMNGPMMAFPGFAGHMPLPAGVQFPNGPPAPGMPLPPAQALNRTMTALERSRRDILEMRSALNDLRNAAGVTDEQRQHIEDAQTRVDRLGDYIDPFRLGSPTGPPQDTGRRSAPPPMGMPEAMAARPIPRQALSELPLTLPMMQRPGTSQDVTCYLLSSPQGPRALLFSPQFGAYTAAVLPQQQPAFYSPVTGLRPTPTAQPTNQAPPAGPRDPVEAAVHQQVQAAVAQQAQAAQGPAGPLQPLLGHVWLLMRILIFAYFLLGSNMGWQRPLILLAICLGFWVIRTGLLGQVAPLRRWWDGIMQIPRDQPPAVAQQLPALRNDARAPQPPQRQQRQPLLPNGRRVQPMPTPEQVAQRLLEEDAARRQQRGGWLREQLRPVERVLALFVASLWPGVGEAHVQAQEREQRRLQEEEVERRRRQEEEEQQSRAADEVKNPKDGGAGSSGATAENGGSGEKVSTDMQDGVAAAVTAEH